MAKFARLIFFLYLCSRIYNFTIMKKAISLLFIALVCMSVRAEETESIRYVGGDISMLPMYEIHNKPYKDVFGKKIEDMIPWAMSECGWNTFRVRIFVNPEKTDPSLCQDLAYVTALGKRIKAAGGYFLLDFHYSDTWVDAGKIQSPVVWKGSDDATMAQHVDTYTREVLNTLKAENATPDLVQVGNEIMYGLCDRRVHPYDYDGDNWNGYLMLLRAGCNAVRELCPDAKIIIHTDRATNMGYNKYYYQKLIDNEVDYDIIGLSYYPFWHGYLTDEQVKSKTDKNNLVKSVQQLAVDFPDKDVQIVEFAYNFQYWPTAGVNYNTQDVWPCSVAGQYKMVKDLVDALLPLENVTGINYWFPEEAGNGDDTDWSTSQGTVLWTWQNRGLWSTENNNGHAINRLSKVQAGQSAADVCAAYYMGKFAGFEPPVLQNIESVAEPESEAGKMLMDGILIIRRNGMRFTLDGRRL